MKALLQLSVRGIIVIMLSYKSPAVKIIKPSAKFHPTPSIHATLLMANDASFPEETCRSGEQKSYFWPIAQFKKL